MSEQPEQLQQPEVITVTDLHSMLNIIQISAERGVFKAEQMEGVGSLYNKLARFIAAIAASQAQAQENTGE
jgi:hypothetical protein